MENEIKLEVLVEDGVNAVKVSTDRWYVAREEVEKNYHKYSKGWHRVYGPATTVTGRKVFISSGWDILNPSPYGMKSFGKVVLGEVVSEFVRQPAGGALAACVNCVPYGDLLLLVNHPSEKVRELVKKRFIRGK